MRPHPSDLRHALWLLPTPSFRVAAFARRGPADAFWLHTTDPDRALANLMERDRIFTDELASESLRTGVCVVCADGRRTISEMAGELAARFGLLR